MYILKVKDQEYKCKLTMENSILLERKIKKNPIMLFEGSEIPPISAMVAVLHASLQEYNHSINEEKALKIFSNWVDDGHSVIEFLEVMSDIFKDAGFIKSEPDEEDELDEVDEEEKN